ncbi:MAG TPA: hypothetical protein VGL48_07785 [Acidimicrobiales bacterium]|jgi:hypothetical protein
MNVRRAWRRFWRLGEFAPEGDPKQSFAFNALNLVLRGTLTDGPLGQRRSGTPVEAPVDGPEDEEDNDAGT